MKWNDLLLHLNSGKPSMQFTFENERSLPFLDTNNHQTDQGNLETNVSRKPTHTDKFLAFFPICRKKFVTRNLLTRAEFRFFHPPAIRRKRAPICVQCLKGQWLLSFVTVTNHTSLRDTSVDEVSTDGFAVFPYIRGVSEPAKRILASHNVKGAMP